MHRSKVGWQWLTIALCLAAVAGCSRSDGRMDVSGVITVDGAPLPTGSINFSPLDGSAVGGGCAVTTGQFQLAGANGLLPGEYRVAIVAYKETGKTINDPQRGPIAEMVPLRFKEATPLTAHVTADGANTFTFPLTAATP